MNSIVNKNEYICSHYLYINNNNEIEEQEIKFKVSIYKLNHKEDYQYIEKIIAIDDEVSSVIKLLIELENAFFPIKIITDNGNNYLGLKDIKECIIN